MLRDTDSLISAAKALNMKPDQYRKSRERIQILQAFIDNGNDAIVEDVRLEVSEKLLEPNSDTDLLRGYYRGAILFRKKIEAVIQMGERKRATLEKIKNAQKE